MKTKKLNITCYQNIAKVFYAVAKIDSAIKHKDIEILKKIVKKQWLQIDETIEVFGVDTAYQIEIVFDWLHSKNANADNCIKDFLGYYQNHSSFFSKEIKDLIMNTAQQISIYFEAKNNPKSLVLDTLQLEFK